MLSILKRSLKLCFSTDNTDKNTANTDKYFSTDRVLIVSLYAPSLVYCNLRVFTKRNNKYYQYYNNNNNKNNKHHQQQQTTTTINNNNY